MAELNVRRKQCPRCGKTKTSSAFAKCLSKKDGLQANCKRCRKAICRRWNISDEGRAYYNAYAKSDKGRAQRAAHARTPKAKARVTRYKASRRGTGEFEARAAVNHAVEKGRMPRARTLRCRHCGKQAHSYHHHKGYAVEHHLDVIPLCHQCHWNEHHPNRL